MNERVTYYSDNDFAFGPEYSKITKRIQLLTGKKILSLVDVLELIEINKYLKSPRVIKPNIEQIKQINGIVGRWFSQCTNENLVNEVKTATLSPVYQDTLWTKLSSCKLDDSILIELLNLYSGTRIQHPLKQKKIATRFGKMLTELLVQTIDNVPIVLNSPSNHIHLPSNFDLTTRSNFFLKYIDSSHPNPTILELIASNKPTSADVRLAAKSRYQQISNQYFQSNTALTVMSQTDVAIDDSMSEMVDVKSEQQKIDGVYTTIIRYSGGSLRALMDWPSILNNFIYIFGFINNFGILTISPEIEQGGVFERIFSPRKDDWFPYEHSLRLKYNLLKLSFKAYYRFLQTNGVHLEKILEWFFNDYLSENFGAQGLSIQMPESNYPNCYKTLILMTQLHRIIRMYHLLALDPKFDRKLIDNFSHTLGFSEMASANNLKYASLINGTLKEEEFNLFSDQNAMPSEDDLTFADMIVQNRIFRSGLNDYQLKVLDKLVESKVLICHKDLIRFQSYELYLILRMDFKNQAIPYTFILSRSTNHPVLDKLRKEKLLTFSNTLLTKQEASVFDYFFSDVYSNGLGLRNKYAHGAFGDLDEEAHFENYLTTLMFITFLVIKINDDQNEKIHQ